MHRLFVTALCLATLTLGGCSAHYRTPQEGVSLASINDADIAELFSLEAASAFPARIALVRIEGRGYQDGFHVANTRDVEREEDIQRLAGLPMVDATVTLSNLLLPPETKTLKDLRLPAAQMRADLLLLYTVDSRFYVDDTPLGPLSLVSLGFIPNHKAHVTSTVSGVLVDVRTGFIYGASEATAKEEQRSNMWSTEEAIDSSRRKAEGQAFHEFVGEFEMLWKGVVEQHARNNRDR